MYNSGVRTPELYHLGNSLNILILKEDIKKYNDELQCVISAHNDKIKKYSIDIETYTRILAVIKDNNDDVKYIRNRIEISEKLKTEEELDVNKIQSTVCSEEHETYSTNNEIIYIDTYNDNYKKISHIRIDECKLECIGNDYYFDITHPIENSVINEAMKYLNDNKSGIIIDILTKNTDTLSKFPDTHSIVLYNLENEIFVIDPNNSDYCKKINKKYNFTIVGEGKLYCCDKNNKNYRNCLDIAIKILSCLNHNAEKISTRNELEQCVYNYTSTEYVNSKNKFYSTFVDWQRFTTAWNIREIFHDFTQKIIKS